MTDHTLNRLRAANRFPAATNLTAPGGTAMTLE